MNYSLQVWKNIRPQLENTIQLRRVHAAPKFLNDRRRCREYEMKDWLSRFRPQLDHIIGQKLFTDQDLLALPIVKELVEENNAKIDMTSERWDLVIPALYEVVPGHLKKIEQDCVVIIEAAKHEASEGSELDQQQAGHEVGDGEIPICLQRATSLLEHQLELMSYVELLRRRARDFRNWSDDKRLAWDQETVESSGMVIFTASRLLGHLQLPSATSMAYMEAYGTVLRCLQCRHGDGSKAMTWPRLVRLQGLFADFF